jgi:hypothetical protein
VKKVTIILLVIAIILLFLVLLFLVLFSGGSSYESGLAKLKGLPEQASNIDYYKLKDIATGLTALDFSISEQDFRKYAESQGWFMGEIEFPRDVKTASYFAGKQEKETTVKKGLFFEKLKENGGGIIVVYDRDNKRAHVFSCKR